MVITMVIGLVVVMPDICGCGLVMGVVVWITKPYGALARVGPGITWLVLLWQCNERPLEQREILASWLLKAASKPP